MKLPQSDIHVFAKEILDQCYNSRQQRRSEYRFWRSLYYSGSTGDTPATYNRCKLHIDRRKSYLYSPAELRFFIGFDENLGEPWLSRGLAASHPLSREYHDAGADQVFGEGVKWSLIKGATLMKHNWERPGLAPYLVQPEFFGVLDESIPDLDHQEAFVHTTYLLPAQLRRMLEDHPERDEILAMVKAAAASKSEDNPKQDDFFHQIIIGGTQPVATQPPVNQSGGMVSIVGGPIPQLSPEVAASLIALHELWIIDDEREDYTTIQMLDPGIVIEGKIKRRNLMGPGEMLKMHQPFVKICANEVENYFWGESSLAPVQMLQDMLNKRISDLQRIWRLQARRPRGYMGFTGITKEINRALDASGGYVSTDNMNAKIQDLSPQLPQGALEELAKIEGWFDDVAGFAPILQGQGEPGIRSQAQAQTMTRNASPMLRDDAMRVERQAGHSGNITFKILQAKNPDVFKSSIGEKFVLAQMPDDYRVTVDSHSASPAFLMDAKADAQFMLVRGVIDPETYIELTHPQNEDILIARARARAQQTAKFLAEHPEVAVKQAERAKR